MPFLTRVPRKECNASYSVGGKEERNYLPFGDITCKKLTLARPLPGARGKARSPVLPGKEKKGRR